MAQRLIRISAFFLRSYLTDARRHHDLCVRFPQRDAQPGRQHRERPLLDNRHDEHALDRDHGRRARAHGNPVLTTPPASPSTTNTGTLLTAYTYDFINHLTNVSMVRAGVTQTRTFTYSPTTLLLSSSTSPESGTSTANRTTSYTYNADNTLATRTGPKNQVTSYSYDAFQRVIQVTHGTDATQTYYYTYDIDPFDPNGVNATNTWGHVALVQWGSSTCSDPNAYCTYNEEYRYTVAGALSWKRLTVYSDTEVQLTATFTYEWTHYRPGQ